MDGWRERTRDVDRCIVKGRDENGREAKKSSPLLCMDVWMECALCGLYGFVWLCVDWIGLMQMDGTAWHGWIDKREGLRKQRTNYDIKRNGHQQEEKDKGDATFLGSLK